MTNPDPNTLETKMYAVISNSEVIDLAWGLPDVIVEGYNYVLMTYENSPAYLGGKYVNGIFYKKGEEING
jgi:hypothetical protein